VEGAEDYKTPQKIVTLLLPSMNSVSNVPLQLCETFTQRNSWKRLYNLEQGRHVSVNE